MEEYLAEVPKDTEVILLPEAWMGSQVLTEEKYKELVFQLYKRLPQEGPLLIPGAQYVNMGSKVYSLGMALGGKLKEPLYYPKIFPSQAIGERAYVEPGNRLLVIEHQGSGIGILVCVDLFYPELARNLALRGALLILNPANIPEERMPLWHSLGLTRACENTVFLAMANNTYTYYPDGREVKGESFVAYPDGYTLLTCGKEPGVYTLDLDLSLIPRVRQRWPYLEDIRKRFTDERGPF